MQIKPGGKIAIAIIVVAAIIGLGKLWTQGTFDKWIPREQKAVVAKKELGDFQEKTGLTRPIRVNVVPWYGYAGLYYMNGGMTASTESRFYKEYGILVDISLSTEIPTQVEQWKAGEADLMWSTADAFPIDASGIKSFSPQIVLQSDWSRGGDAIVVTRGIDKVSDLRGKKVAVAFGTPSHTFLYWILNSSGLDWSDIQVAKYSTAEEAAKVFKAGQVDAAVVWSPDDKICVSKVPGAKVFKSTKTATHIIADIFYAKKDWLASNNKTAQALVEGWIKANGLIGSDPVAKAEAAKIMAAAMNVPVEDAVEGLGNVRLTTHGDNLNFFGLNSQYKGVTGSDLYDKMTRVYSSMGLADNPPSWTNIINTSFIQFAKLSSFSDKAEGETQFKPVTEQEKTASAFSSKALDIVFPPSSYALSDEAKVTIDKFAEIAKTFTATKVRVVGNTDNTGSYDKNKILSLKRAQSVVSYLVTQYGFSQNRFIVRGDGPDSPKGDNSTPEGRQMNRRTDFELVSVD